MITIPQGRYVGIATMQDLRDIQLVKAWKDIQLDKGSRVGIVLHPDGSDRWVFAVQSIYLVIPPILIAA